MTIISDYTTASHAFLDLVADIKPSQLDEPSFGPWDVRSMVGHTSQVINVVEKHLIKAAPPAVTAPDAVSYFIEVYTDETDHDFVHARGAEAGQRLTEDSHAEFSATLERTLVLIAENGLDRIIQAGPIAISLGDYLRTRALELVIHCMDIAQATGLEHGIPEDVLADVSALAARVAVRRGYGQQLLFALSGRSSLPGSFSVL
jgi:uncharacterized protein (TIGR03083 family)